MNRLYRIEDNLDLYKIKFLYTMTLLTGCGIPYESIADYRPLPSTILSIKVIT